MKKFSYPLLAKEGKFHITFAVVFGLIFTYFFKYVSIPIWVGVLFVVQFFRDPKRNITTQNNAVVSPASGKIVSIIESSNPYLIGMKSLKVTIFMNIFSVHSNLIPISGEIRKVWYFKGSFINAALDKCSSRNERNAIWIRTHNSDDVISVQIAGFIARRICCYVNKGDLVCSGQRYGFIRFGSRVELCLPIYTKLSIQLGQWISSGDIIGII